MLSGISQDHHSSVTHLLKELKKKKKKMDKTLQGNVPKNIELFVFSLQLSADVYRILSLPKGGPVVLFKGGGVRTLDVLLEAPQQEIENIISDEVIK